ncbi:MAG: hypothetical protein HKN03_08565 [Acidimicrobiales bacterium]|nr:hypothetical protein [Acidimicrobiales bacterium]
MPEVSEPLASVLAESARLGFLGPGPIEDHLVHAHGYEQNIPVAAHGQQQSLLDLGSGGGIPGLPLLMWRTDLTGVLLDAMAKRTRFLDHAVLQLGLTDRVRVVTARAEEALLQGEGDLLRFFDLVVARSFGPPSVTLELAAHFCRLQGRILISEPPGGRAWEPNGVAGLGLEQVSEAGAPIAVFASRQSPPPLRRWKVLVQRPAVRVTAI